VPARPSIVRSAVVESLPLLLGIVALVLTLLLAPDRLEEDFLDAAVQIIPFLLLALALETRLLGLGAPAPEQRFDDDGLSHGQRLLVAMIGLNRKLAALLAVGMLVWAEAAGLAALNGHTASTSLGPFLLGAIVSGMVTVGVAALLPRRPVRRGTVAG
jgi:hypothetical protein